MSPHKIRAATPAHHDRLVRIAKQSKHCSSFSNRLMFSSDAAYEKGWIRFIHHRDDPTTPLGFYCVRHKVREPVTVLYFIVVDSEHRSQGLGDALMEDLIDQAGKHTTYGREYSVQLNVAKDNPRAVAFYERLGFHVISEDALKGTAYTMEYAL